MGEVVNLRQAAKRLARVRKAKAAHENRLLFGRTGNEKRQEQSEKRRSFEKLDAHRLDAGLEVGLPDARADGDPYGPQDGGQPA